MKNNCHVKYSSSPPVHDFVFGSLILDKKLNDQRSPDESCTSDGEEAAGNRVPPGPTGKKPKWWADKESTSPFEGVSPQTGSASVVCYHG